ncbi:hypothetical protein Glove_120g241 [Diversispora epigaea]|uniref:Uncharacterized protein n=1 Tax=Diversispora epigaea TaxID=1348612 RepID=A0A397J8J0_9GLOM|nr:hypothetical protein Glove_120g241 [Diversispora epigaea]
MSYSRVRDKLSEYGENYIINNIKISKAWLQFAKYYLSKYIRKYLLKLRYEINNRDYWENFVFHIKNNLTSHKQIGNDPEYRNFKVQLVFHYVNAKGKYEKYNSKTSDYMEYRSFASSETDTSDNVEILTYISKDKLAKKIHKTKDLGSIYSKPKKK